MEGCHNGNLLFLSQGNSILAKQGRTVDMEDIRICFRDSRLQLPVHLRNRTGIAGKGNPEGHGREQRIRETVLFQVMAFHSRADHGGVLHMPGIFMDGFRHTVDHREIVINKLHRAQRLKIIHPFFLHGPVFRGSR